MVANEAFWEAVRRLPKRQAQCVALHYLEDRPVADVAALLDIAEATVRGYLHQGRAALAVSLDVHLGEEDDESLDQRARDAGAEVRDQVATIEPPTPGVIARRSRRGRVATGLAAIAVLALAGVGLAVALQDDPGPTRLKVTDDPEPTTVPGVPVWYDANGLHRGDVVEQTPVELGAAGRTATLDGGAGAGAVGCGVPGPRDGRRVVPPLGRGAPHRGTRLRGGPRRGPRTATPPPGSKGSDAWRDGSGELVVYDTAAGREISRTEQPRPSPTSSGEHSPPGNSFLQVSAERVVWQASTLRAVHASPAVQP